MNETFDRDSWELRWAQVLREHPLSLRPCGGVRPAMVTRLAGGVAPGGTLLLVGSGVDAVMRAVYQP